MCGRFTQTHSADAIAQILQLPFVPVAAPRYNIAPTQFIGAVVQTPSHLTRQFRALRWGLIPSWAKDPAIGNRLINARAETVTEKPSFRSAIRYRRCLILADGFYEWQRQEQQKQPFYFHFKDRSLFAFAGLWEHWQSASNEIVETCTILTTRANDLVSRIHDRMPVILQPDDYDTWLDPELTTAAKVLPLLQPYPAADMAVYPVEKTVNRPSNDSPACIQAIALSNSENLAPSEPSRLESEPGKAVRSPKNSV